MWNKPLRIVLSIFLIAILGVILSVVSPLLSQTYAKGKHESKGKGNAGSKYKSDKNDSLIDIEINLPDFYPYGVGTDEDNGKHGGKPDSHPGKGVERGKGWEKSGGKAKGIDPDREYNWKIDKNSKGLPYPWNNECVLDGKNPHLCVNLGERAYRTFFGSSESTENTYIGNIIGVTWVKQGMEIGNHPPAVADSDGWFYVIENPNDVSIYRLRPTATVIVK